MAAVMNELIQVLISKQGPEKITKEEREIFLDVKSKVLNSAIIGATVATGLAYIATRRLNTVSRLGFAGGAGTLAGSWRLNESFNSCVDYVLDLDGTRIQDELRKIIVQRYGDDPYRMQRFSKHFYREEVYNDLNVEHPRAIYRLRNSFMDNQRIANANVYGAFDADEQVQTHLQKNHESNSLKLRGTSMEIKQVRANPGISKYGYGDPLEVLFGYSSTTAEVHQPDTKSSDSVKLKGRALKRAQRKERIRHRHRDSSSLGDAVAS